MQHRQHVFNRRVNNIESLKKINGYAEQKGITECLENLFGRSIDQSFENLIEIRNAVASSQKHGT